MASRLPSVSIIVPALNEAENIAPLVARIDTTLRRLATYEIIFVDDHSTDSTVEAIISIAANTKHLMRKIRLHTKVGKQGKAYSLLEGFELARYEYICIIDADLQYPPEAIPGMLTILSEGVDIVVANRIAASSNAVRRMLSRTGRKLYGEWLYGFSCDVQSGLKVFRKSILERIVLNTTSWTFDLSFLVQARERGHVISSVPIPFAERNAGTSKVNIMRVGSEIVIEAIKFKLSKRQTVAYVDSLVEHP
jgi:dolichol-phosphate mannosyltransferase